MRMTKLFNRTLRQEPSEADTVSHRLLLKAGLVQQVAAGVYAYLPLAWRTLKKIERIIREEMDAAGGQELFLPNLNPRELWEESGRWDNFGPELIKLKDRKGRDFCLAPTHEEVVTDLVRHRIQSYRDLPTILYQIQVKMRDEPRPRGGLVRVREFTMKDAYSFDSSAAGLDRSYRAMFQAYKNIFSRCGLPSVAVEADSGAIGGKDSHEFMLLAPTGENEIISCEKCGYAANQERASFRKSAEGTGNEPLLPMEEVATPGIKTIAQLASYLAIPSWQTAKAVFYTATFADREELVFAVIRGDYAINETKLRNYLKSIALELASDEMVHRFGLVAGSASPVGLKGVRVVVDDSIALAANLVAGGNKPDAHLRNVNFPRDFQAEAVIDIATARQGDPCPRCGEALRAQRGIEVGHVFKLGTVYTEKMGATFLDKEGVAKPIIMGCYGIGIGRLMAAAIEQNNDEKGIIWPLPIAPYHVHLVALSPDSPQVGEAAEKLYEELQAAGLEVLFDDRLESPGVKFNDADLLGMPLRLTVSPRNLKDGNAELKLRTEKVAETIPLSEVAGRAISLLKTTA
ncbi:MAG: proline--tRNA ligase [Chloroflexota bacterium]|nr:proline--tRNA ligase [Chloroflexota bacterium]